MFTWVPPTGRLALVSSGKRLYSFREELAALAESYLWGAATLLRGTIDAGDYKQFIFPMLFLKRLWEVHAREGNLSIPFYVAPAGANAGSDADASPAARPDLAGALAGWLESSRNVRQSRRALLEPAGLSSLVLTQVMGIFCVITPVPKHAASTDRKVLDRLHRQPAGWVFTPAHLADLGTRNAVASALKRLKAAGAIRQLTRGLYDRPVQHPVFGTVAPSADAVARALVGRDAIRLQPSGAYAANVLGLSEQVPSRVVFLTDGPARRVKIGRQEILLQHTVPRNMATAGRKSGTLIQALRYLGRPRVDERVRAALRRQIVTDQDRATLRQDLRHAPAWIADLLRPLTAEPAPTP